MPLAPALRVNWAHVHLIVNEVPVIGSAFAAVLLFVAWFLPVRDVWTRAGLLVLGLAMLGLVAAFFTGIPAVDVISGAPRTSGKALSQHHMRGLVAVAFAVMASVSGVVAFVLARKRGSFSRRSVALVLVMTIGAAGGLVWTGEAGGRINHPELQRPGDLDSGPAHPH
jgi:hypothetical protein